MNQDQATYDAFSKAMEFWSKLWRQNYEQSLAFWAMMGQSVPRASARELAAEAESMKSKT
ncbi:hypothetical protein [Pararhodobacter sp.]|uniref:hypothetical protein n=1 Tax=Pararhodobacter sp. TaxID=2127056 RepID=UPI002AFEF14B|nr:hypothetical protein [Pararhodobacter sp.]